MKRFIGVKLINAVSMTRLAYNQFRGWDLPKDENGDDKGYLVEYVDGGKANTKEYVGYVSWSPEEVFNRAYSDMSLYENGIPEAEVSEAYQERVCDEYDELHVKIGKLEEYISFNHDELLELQLKYMIGYAVVLGNRIESFK